MGFRSAVAALSLLFMPVLSLYGQKDLRSYLTDNLRDPMEIIAAAAPGNDIISIGEEHMNDNLRLYVASEVIPCLDSAGYKFVALELESMHQEQMDDYTVHGRRPENETLFTDVILNDRYSLGDAYLEFLDSARSHGWDIYCIDVGGNLEPVTEKSDSLSAELLMKMKSERNPDDKGLLLYGSDHTREGFPDPYNQVPLGEHLERMTGGRHFSIGTVGNSLSTYADSDFRHVPDSSAFLTDDPDISSRVFYEFDPRKADVVVLDGKMTLIFDKQNGRPHIYRELYGPQYDAIIHMDAFKGYPRNGHDQFFVCSVRIEYDGTKAVPDTITYR